MHAVLLNGRVRLGGMGEGSPIAVELEFVAGCGRGGAAGRGGRCAGLLRAVSAQRRATGDPRGRTTTRLPCRRSWVRLPSSALTKAPKMGPFLYPRSHDCMTAPAQAEPSKAATATGVIPQLGSALRFLFGSLERLPACLLALYGKRVEHLALLVSMS